MSDGRRAADPVGRHLGSPATSLADPVRSPGRPFEAPIRERIERAYGWSFAEVRVHDDYAAGMEALRRGASAFTQGPHVFFAPGRYRPDTDVGWRRVAHEAAHVVQQARSALVGDANPGGADAESEARVAAAHAVAGDRATIGLVAAPGVQRDPMSYDEIVARLAEVEAEVAEPVSRSDAELAALHTERNHLIRLLGEAPQAVTPTPGSRGAASTRATEPVTSEPPASEISALTSEEMVEAVITQRGFSSARPTPEGGMTPPSFEPGPLGPGYQTNAAIEIIDAQGNQVAFASGEYSGGGGPHAEAEAAATVVRQLGGQRFPGGRLVAAVDQVACPACMARLRELAQRLGLERLEVWTPGRTGASGRPVSPKWASRSSTVPPRRPGPAEPVGGRYRVEATLQQGETLEPVAAPEVASASPTARPSSPAPEVIPEAPPVEAAAPAAPTTEAVPPEVVPETAASPRGGGWGSGLLGVAPIGIGLLYGWAQSRRMRRQVEREGFAPVGAAAHADEDVVTRLGRWMLDPTLGATVPASQRFEMQAWRRHVRESARGRNRVTVTWERPSSDDPAMPMVDHVNVDYQRVNGRWQVVPGQSFPHDFTPPDLNPIVDEGTSDSEVQFGLACAAGECA